MTVRAPQLLRSGRTYRLAADSEVSRTTWWASLAAGVCLLVHGALRPDHFIVLVSAGTIVLSSGVLVLEYAALRARVVRVVPGARPATNSAQAESGPDARRRMRRLLGKHSRRDDAVDPPGPRLEDQAPEPELGARSAMSSASSAASPVGVAVPCPTTVCPCPATVKAIRDPSTRLRRRTDPGDTEK